LLCFCLLLVSNVAVTAPAPTRETVIATAMRCSVIADSHQWLDCFYGSAQQMRGALKLSPAPNAQLLLTENPPSGGTVYDAEVRVSILSAAISCRNLGDDRKWLNCYYGSSDPMRLRLGLQPISHDVPPPSLPATGGLAVASKTAAAPPLPLRPANESSRFPLVSQVKSYSLDQQGIFTIVLANGQIWRQLSGDTNNVRHLSPNDAIIISRGAFGSYNMRIGKHPEYFKVDLIK
jgi:hypothetical protein